MTPSATILAKALKPYQGDYDRTYLLALRAGVPREIVARATNGAQGQPTRAEHYLHLCAVLGIDPLTGWPCAAHAPQALNKKLFAIAVRMARLATDATLAEAAKRMGISKTALSRIENGDVRSFEAMLAACRYARVHPLLYVTRETLTGNRLKSNEQILRAAV